MKKFSKRIAVLAVAVVLGLALFVSPAYAEQYGPYDNPQSNVSIVVDKAVAVPHFTKDGKTDYTYVDNLSTNDYRYGAQDYVFFRLRVKNTSSVQIDNVVVSDFGPDYVQMYENPGKVDGNTLKIEVGSLKPQEEKEYIVKGRVAQQDSLPADKGIVCVTNKVRSEATSSGKTVADDDSSQFCIEKSVTQSKGGVPPTVPQAGPESGLVIMGLAGLISVAGMKLRKITG